MKLTAKKMFWVILMFCLWTGANAQTPGGENVTINTNPQGALVTLEGETSFSGVTPVKFERPLNGRYKITVDHEGFEKYSSTAYFSETHASNLSIKLTPKTRVRAFFRSLVIPGWGQKYYGNRSKAALFALGTALSAAGYVIIKDDYDSKVETFNDKKALRAAATKWSDVVRLESEVHDAQKKANDAEDRLNIMTGVAIGVYALNLLDSFLLFPEYNTVSEYKAITVKPEVVSGAVGLSLTMKF